MGTEHEYIAWKMVFQLLSFFFFSPTDNLLYINQRKLKSKQEDTWHYVTCLVTAFMSPNKVAAGLTLFPSSSAQISTYISKRKMTINSGIFKRFFFKFKCETLSINVFILCFSCTGNFLCLSLKWHQEILYSK